MQAVVLVVGMALMAIKFVAWRLTHSNTILSDALESIVNVVAGAFALYSLVLSSKPRDREHPYGHGKAEEFSAGVEGALIVVAAILTATLLHRAQRRREAAPVHARHAGRKAKLVRATPIPAPAPPTCRVP